MTAPACAGTVSVALPDVAAGEHTYVATYVPHDDSFIGSDSTLVAPVSIGDGAYVGAGSCITRPVPDGALAIGRSQQVTKEGWAAARKAARAAKKP